MYPYSGLRVLDLSRILVGPYATMILSDLGAEVIKVESFDGDETRQWGPPYLADQSTYFLSINRNKKSICIDLKKGKDFVHELVKVSDVLVENFTTGVTARLGLDYSTLKSINPRLIYASVNGFGNKGLQKEEAGFDLIAQGLTGFMHISGESNGPPQKTGVAIIDILTALHACSGIQAALYHRSITGQGSLVETSLFESACASLANISSMYLNAGKDLKRMGNMHASISPYGVYKIQEEYLVLGVAQNNQFAALCKVLGIPELNQDARFSQNKGRVENREQLTQILESEFRKWDINNLIAKLKQQKVPVGKVQSTGECLESQQAKELGLVYQVGEEKMVRSPLNLNGQILNRVSRAPRLNQDRDYVCSLLNITDPSNLIKLGVLKE